jgi:hypothetical protein
MRKRIHSRRDISADNRGSGKNPHLSDEQILLTLDGELSSREAAKVGLHLEACWSCRARSQQIEAAIADIVEYRDCLVRPYFPVSPGGLEGFVTRLEELARAIGQSSLKSRIIGPLRVLQASLQDLVPRHAWISALVIGSFAVFLFTRLWQAPRVSASQLLENSRAFEFQKLHSVAKPVVYQKLHIRVGTKAVTRTIYRDSVRMRQVDQVGASGESSPSQTRNHAEDLVRVAAEAELRGAFLAAHLNWEDPLSAASYSSWHDSLYGKQDEVMAAENREFLTLKTTPSQGSISEARITFRAADFHPVEEELRLKDASEVEITEMAWDVLPMEAVNPAIFSQEPERHVEPERPMNLSMPPQGPSDAQLAETELQARVAMHVAEADLGEQIELERDTTGSSQRMVIVRGIVSSAGRKNELLGMFRGVPHLELRLQTLEEAKAQENTSGADGVQNPNASSDQDVVPGEIPMHGGHGLLGERGAPIVSQPVFEPQLEERYPRSEDRIAFINKVVELAQDALAQAWALRRLRDRYTPDAVAELSHGSRQTLELLIRDHVSLLRQHVNATQDLISPLLPPGSTPQPTLADRSEPAAVEINDWRNSVTETFLETQRLCDSVVALFAGSGAAAAPENRSLVDDLNQALAKLQIQLPALYESVSEPLIATPSSSSRDQR